ncbi:[Fe-Fe] hydrogenase large subunit C-terminal domain-containing protein [Campylobacter ureolyticus]|uniref:[Fe-Fe] hydrogenase large subunit C-terminal domain-containing protein n=1 Tax=Campylobacter ureolyticus TaxID=827 RepID=UPI0022B5639D|nr:[Fe-Fe] hydrogenase large subunit C-terminal domain-containing protein [Campylobacter ureolyticus]MCZ6134973.1 4Fe-4S binding protein [Campylobacter ureolyticus]MCZ6170118.1 4Fe-4S binding protein [Campylobacter ureolyticus]
MGSVSSIKTFAPPVDARGGGVEFEGTYRKGELRGIIKINQDNCTGCDTCSAFCPTDAIMGTLGVAHAIEDNSCVACGQCLINCPFGAIEQMSFVDEVIKKLDDPKSFVVAHPSPAVRVALAEEFGAEPGSVTINKMYNAFKKAGFHMYDVNFAADHTILEEGTEFIKKVKYWLLGERSKDLEHVSHHPFPHFTSCCPAWVRNAEIFHPELIPHISGAKSPIQMGGPIAKTWGAKFIWKVDPRDVFMVPITPCTAKIFEASRPEFNSAWKYLIKNNEIPSDTPSFPDIDVVLTARDIATLLKKKGINPLEMSDEYEDEVMNVYSGGGTIFGNSGGVMEAALRTSYFILSGMELKNPDLIPVRGYDKDLVEATIPVPLKDYDGKIIEIKVAVVNGASKNINKIAKELVSNQNKYHFIEVMNCPGGCVNGGGQPVRTMGTSWLHPLLPLPIRA